MTTEFWIGFSAGFCAAVLPGLVFFLVAVFKAPDESELWPSDDELAAQHAREAITEQTPCSDTRPRSKFNADF